MGDIIKLNSRGGENNYLKKMPRLDGSESKTYVLKTESQYIRAGYVDEKHKFIDPSGGPMIVEDSILPEAGAKVTSITFVSGYGHTITFE